MAPYFSLYDALITRRKYKLGMNCWETHAHILVRNNSKLLDPAIYVRGLPTIVARVQL